MKGETEQMERQIYKDEYKVEAYLAKDIIEKFGIVHFLKVMAKVSNKDMTDAVKKLDEFHTFYTEA